MVATSVGLGISGTLPKRDVAPRVTTVRLPSLRYWRVQLAWHQEELAKQAGVSMATLWRIETGRPAGDSRYQAQARRGTRCHARRAPGPATR